jgi:cysteine desulfurase
VFFCRSGNRSGKALACLRRLGHRNAWHVAGGIALAEAALALAA